MIQIPLTPEEFTARRQQLQREHGITLEGNEGKITKSGVTAAYRYAEGLLKVNILEKPFFVSTDYCEEQLKTFLAK